LKQISHAIALIVLTNDHAHATRHKQRYIEVEQVGYDDVACEKVRRRAIYLLGLRCGGAGQAPAHHASVKRETYTPLALSRFTLHAADGLVLYSKVPYSNGQRS
jgi:hypothetical protein